MMIVWPYLVVVLSSHLGNAEGEDIPTLVSGGPVSGWVGSSVILPVQVTPPTSVIEYIVHWSRLNQLNESIIDCHFENHQNHSSRDKDCHGRARFIGNPYEGDVSMQLINLTLEDNRKYMCSVENPTKWKIHITINLTVKAMGSIPLLSFSDAAESELVNVTCESDGWYPEPTIIWTNNKGEVLSSSVFRGSNSLINASSWVLVSPSESEWVSCSVGISDQDRRESRVEPHTNTDLQIGNLWKLAFITLLVLLFIGMVVVGILYTKGIDQIPGHLKITQVLNEGTPLTDEGTPLTGKRSRHKASGCQYSSI